MTGIETITNLFLEYFDSLGYPVISDPDTPNLIKSYSNIDDEIYALFKGVGVRNISHEGIIELSGKDAMDFLHRITTNSLKDVAKGSLVDTIFTTEKGRIIDVASILNFEDHQLLLCSFHNKGKVMSWISKYVLTDDVKLSDAAGKYTVLQVIGPQADSFITLLAGEIVNKTERDSFKIAIVEGMMFFLVKRIGEDGHNNFIIITEAGNGLGIVKYMQNNKGPFDFKMVGEDAYNLYRVEHGIPAAPNELNDLYNPYEVELINLVNFKKGCYIGQEVIARLDAFDKVQRKLKRITIEKMVDKNEEYTLFDENDKDVGKITSLAYSKKSDKLLGLAYVRKAYSEEGTKLIIRNSHNNSVEVIVHNLKSKK